MSEAMKDQDHGHSHNQPGATANAPNSSRRDWLFTIGVATNAIAGFLLAIPLVGFVFSSFVERKDPRDWIALGAIENFPVKTTRIASLPKSIYTPLGWGYRQYSVLGPAPRRREVSGLRYQLHSSWLSGPLV